LKATAIIDTIIAKVKDILENHSTPLAQPLTLENAENVVQIIKTAIIAGGAEGFKTYLEQNESRDNTMNTVRSRCIVHCYTISRVTSIRRRSVTR